MPEIPPEQLDNQIRPRSSSANTNYFIPSPTNAAGAGIPPADAPITRAPVVPITPASPASTSVPPSKPIERPLSVAAGDSLTIDDAIRFVVQRKDIRLDELSRLVGWKQPHLEKAFKLLEARGILELQYPPSLVQSPRINLIHPLQEKIIPPPQGNVIESYISSADRVDSTVQIISLADEQRPFYHLHVQTYGPYTNALLDEMREGVAAQVPIENIDLSDAEQAHALKEKFQIAARSEITKLFGNLSENLLASMAGQLLHQLYGLGELELMLADNYLEEVAINSSKSPVTVYHLKYGWMKSNLLMSGEDSIANLSSQIGRKVGREITNLHPIMDAHLLSGDRVNATLFPISSLGNTLTIRRFARKPWTIIDFIGKEKTMSTEMAAWLWLSMQYELSILVAGSTAAGKTSALNALLSFIPAHQRVITIEDVRELNLPDYMKWNWVPLTTRNPNPEGSGEVSMLDLLISSLRMRPDRLIVGEMRTREEAEVLFEAMHTGHSVYATIHADSARQVLRRLIEPPIAIPPLEVEAIDLVLVQYRDRKSNSRKSYEIAEIEAGVTGEQVGINDIYRWVARGDTWEKVSEPTRLIQKLNLHTGMTQRDIENEVADRVVILNWLVRRNYSNINQVGNAMRAFYADPKRVKDAAMDDQDPVQVLG